MDAESGVWIRTERSHPILQFTVAGSAVVVGAIFAYGWLYLLVPLGGTHYAIEVLVFCAIPVAAMELLVWTSLEPSGVRVTGSGIEIRRYVWRNLEIPRDQVILHSRPPGGFGYVNIERKSGCVLSPNQFIAARRHFTVAPPTGWPREPPDSAARR